MKLDQILNLVPEALNTTAELAWRVEGNTIITNFEIDDREYEIYIERHDFSDFNIDDVKTVCEVSFTGKTKGGSATYRSTGNNLKDGHNLKVFSIVKNGIEAKLKTIEYDVVFFDAKNTGDEVYSSRVKLYQRLTGLFRKQLQVFAFSKEYSNFYLFVLAKQQIEEHLIDAIVSLVAHGR